MGAMLKKAITFGLAAAMVAACLPAAVFTEIAEAEPETLGNGQVGNCVWSIDGEDGEYTLSITPSNGSAGDCTMDGLVEAPWSEYASSITSVSFGRSVALTGSADAMFAGCSSLTSLDLSGLDTSQVTSMYRMFRGCSSLASLNLSGLDTSQVTYMNEMFRDCSSLASLELTGLDTSQVTSMDEMFCGCSSLISLDLRPLNTSSVTDMDLMFYRCSSLTSLALASLNTSRVTSMSAMFSGCSGLTSIDLSSFDTSQVTDMSYMFSSCSGLTSIDLSSFDTSQVTNMRSMYYGCSGLASIDLSPFVTDSVTNMGGMFEGCSGLTSIDLSSFDTSQVTDMYSMFSKCSSLTTLNLSGFDTSSLEGEIYCPSLSGCNSLTSFIAPAKLKYAIDLPVTSGNEWRDANGVVRTQALAALSTTMKYTRSPVKVATKRSEVVKDVTIGGVSYTNNAKKDELVNAYVDGKKAKVSVDVAPGWEATIYVQKGGKLKKVKNGSKVSVPKKSGTTVIVRMRNLKTGKVLETDYSIFRAVKKTIAAKKSITVPVGTSVKLKAKGKITKISSNAPQVITTTRGIRMMGVYPGKTTVSYLVKVGNIVKTKTVKVRVAAPRPIKLLKVNKKNYTKKAKKSSSIKCKRAKKARFRVRVKSGWTKSMQRIAKGKVKKFKASKRVGFKKGTRVKVTMRGRDGVMTSTVLYAR